MRHINGAWNGAKSISLKNDHGEEMNDMLDWQTKLCKFCGLNNAIKKHTIRLADVLARDYFYCSNCIPNFEDNPDESMEIVAIKLKRVQNIEEFMGKK